MRRVLLDCDGVLSDFTSSAIAVVNDMFDTKYKPEHVTAFDFTASLGLAREQGAAVKRRIGSTPGFCLHMRPYPGAREAIAELRKLAEVYIVTSPWNSNPTWMHERELWLERHVGIPHSQVVHTSAKHLVRGDVFVDDKLEAVERWQCEHARSSGVLWRTMHNIHESWIGRTANSWDALIEMVRS